MMMFIFVILFVIVFVFLCVTFAFVALIEADEFKPRNQRR
jgi:hypothetical protein